MSSSFKSGPAGPAIAAKPLSGWDPGSAGYFEVPLDQLTAGMTCDFPLYICLARSERFLLRHDRGCLLSEDLLRKHESAGLNAFWSPLQFKPTWLAYLAERDSASALGEDTPPADAALESYFTSRMIPALMTDQNLSDEQKVKALTQISQALLGELICFSGESPAAGQRAYENCAQFAAQVMQASLDVPKIRPLYESTLRLVSVGGKQAALSSFLSVTFGLASGTVNREGLADLAIGALLQDIGFINLKPGLVNIPETNRTLNEKEAYQEHVRAGLDILERRKIPITDGVRAILAQHHERFDGSGYPRRLSGKAIHPLAQVTAFANQMCDFVTGTYDGIKYGPAEAVALLSNLQGNNRIIQRFDPDFFAKMISALAQASAGAAPTDEWPAAA